MLATAKKICLVHQLTKRYFCVCVFVHGSQEDNYQMELLELEQVNQTNPTNCRKFDLSKKNPPRSGLLYIHRLVRTESSYK